MEFGYCPNCIAIQLLHCRQLGRLGRTGVGARHAGRAGGWARRALGAQGKRALSSGRAGAGRWVSGRRALGRVTRRRTTGGRTRGARGARGRGARHERQARGCASGDTAEGLLRHGASARSARGHARPGRGLVRWLGQLGAHAASLVFDLGF